MGEWPTNLEFSLKVQADFGRRRQLKRDGALLLASMWILVGWSGTSVDACAKVGPGEVIAPCVAHAEMRRGVSTMRADGYQPYATAISSSADRTSRAPEAAQLEINGHRR